MSLKLIFAKNLKEKRHELGLTQEELAEMCGLHRTYIGALERAERNITLSTLEQIADSLKANPLELLKD